MHQPAFSLVVTLQNSTIMQQVALLIPDYTKIIMLQWAQSYRPACHPERRWKGRLRGVDNPFIR